MKRNIILVCLITMIALLLYTDINTIKWFAENSDPGFDWTKEIAPLIVNNLIWLPIIPLYLLWKSNNDFHSGLLALTVVTSIVQVATTLYAEVATSPKAAGLPFVLLTIPYQWCY